MTARNRARLRAHADLPLVRWEQCLAQQQLVDVVVVIDASTSMEQLTTADRTTLEAALTFIDQLHLDRRDQAAIVAFNHEAEVVQPLTSDRTLCRRCPCDKMMKNAPVLTVVESLSDNAASACADRAQPARGFRIGS